MLNIEVIKFEAQDVITTSVAAPVVPETPAPVDPNACNCGDAPWNTYQGGVIHKDCPATEHTGAECGKFPIAHP